MWAQVEDLTLPTSGYEIDGLKGHADQIQVAAGANR
jgi:hypothetical protein